VVRKELLSGRVLDASQYASVPTTEITSPTQAIENVILFIRGHRVILDSELAGLYGIETKALVRAVRRNLDRFPGDFMFQLDPDEFARLRSQIGTSKPGRGGRRYSPYVFTEQGVAMLSSVLRSDRAVQVNVEIMRAFVRLRQILAANDELARRLDELESRYDARFKAIFDAIRHLMAPEGKPHGKIGFRLPGPE
jgi:hypothetical protein